MSTSVKQVLVCIDADNVNIREAGPVVRALMLAGDSFCSFRLFGNNHGNWRPAWQKLLKGHDAQYHVCPNRPQAADARILIELSVLEPRSCVIILSADEKLCTLAQRFSEIKDFVCEMPLRGLRCSQKETCRPFSRSCNGKENSKKDALMQAAIAQWKEKHPRHTGPVPKNAMESILKSLSRKT